MAFGELAQEEIGVIVLGLLVLAAVIFWRIWMGRKEKGDKDENPD